MGVDKRWLNASLIVVTLAVLSMPARAVTRYNVTDLGPILSTGDTGKDVNESGVVAFTQSTDVYLHNNGVTTPLAGVGAGNGPLALNDLGHLAGADGLRGYFYADGVKKDVGSLDSSWLTTTFAVDLNNSDTVVGVCYLQSENAWRAFTWVNGTMSALPAPEGHSYGLGISSEACAINDSGTIVGQFHDSSIVLWQDGRGRLLPTPAGYSWAYPRGLNNLNQVVGYVRDSGLRTVPAIWTGDSVSYLDLYPGVPCAQATAINDFGQAVGYIGWGGQFNGLGVLWEGGGIYTLNSLIDTPDWTIWNLSAINDTGMIVGWGQHTLPGGITEQRSVLLTPVPEPAASVVLLPTLALLHRPLRSRQSDGA